LILFSHLTESFKFFDNFKKFIAFHVKMDKKIYVRSTPFFVGGPATTLFRTRLATTLFRTRLATTLFRTRLFATGSSRSSSSSSSNLLL
jgi:hypothetical protein